MPWLLALGLMLAPSVVRTAELPPPAARPVDFVKDIQPIFAARCYGCHGPQRQEAGYRLDAREVALHGGDLGPAILPGKSAESLLVQFIAGAVEGKVMPRKGERLTAGQVGLVRAWIDQGAHWPESASVKVAAKTDHWAFQAPTRPAVPEIRDSRSAIRNPIDAFVLARLQREGLVFSPEADKPTLLRRLKLDLLGLPPTPGEVDEFLADTSAGAYDKWVERFLASPHYGERWGRHWLDAARYADSNGFEKDAARSVWPYRDYVIQAHNRDLPFDQFTVEQLAGDLLEQPTLDQRVATGFLRNSMMNQEGGIEPEQFRVEAMIDRMDAIGRAWLGLTIACAQCHNHKYDPISQKEYFQFFSFLNNDDEPAIEVPTAEQQRQREALRTKIRLLEEKAMRDSPDLAARMADWESRLREAGPGDWTVLPPREWLNFATKYERQSDGSLLGGGDVKPGAVTHVWADTTLTNITGFRLEALLHPNLPDDGPGLVARGGWLLKEFTCEAYALTNATVTNLVKFRRASASLEAPGFAVTNAIDGNTEKGGWTASTLPVVRHAEASAVFECAEPIMGFPGGTRLRFTVYQKHSNGDGHSGAPDKDTGLDCHAFGRFRLSATTRSGPLEADPLNAAQRRWLAAAPEERSPGQRRELFNVFRRTQPDLAAMSQELDRHWTNWVYAARTLALSARTEPRETRVFRRGDWQRPGENVEAGTPAVLHPLPADAPRNRLGLARWLVDRRSPTTARVIVNRVWQAYFGQGLFTTPEDIGTRADPASHPELLDWLAVEFMEPEARATRRESPPWSLKHLHRLIVHSATYRQSSRLTPELLAVDPYNRLLARGPRFRVEAEVVQDIALAASGLLNPKIGGPSVYPPVPASVADQVYGGFSWPESQGADRYRRAMYTFWKRALPFPAMLAFDAPPAENSCTRRVRSNTPLQALVTLNEKTFVEAAQAMGLRVLREGGADNRARAIHAFRLCTGRAPTEAELKSILVFWEEQYRRFEDDTASALRVALPVVTNVPPGVNLHKAAAWAMVSRALLNLDETITKE